MNKIFKSDSIIKISDDLTLVIDKDTHRNISSFSYLPDGAWSVAKNTNVLFKQEATRLDVRWHDRVIATIGTKRLDGVPCIELNNKIRELAYNAAKNKFPHEDDTSKMYAYQGGFQDAHMAAQPKEILELTLEYESELLDNGMKICKCPNWDINKEGNLVCTGYCEKLKIQNDSIIPVSVKYKN